MTVKDLITALQQLKGDSEVRFVYNTAQPMWAKSIGVKDIVECEGVVFVIEDDWNVPEWVPEGLIEE